MSITLSAIRDQVETRLSDSSNLIFATSTLDEAIRAALSEIATAYGSDLTLEDLDSATATTMEDQDQNALITGAVAFALRFRLIGKFEEAFPDRNNPENLASAATAVMNHFQSMLIQIRLRRFQSASDHPYTAWDWDEGSDFT